MKVEQLHVHTRPVGEPCSHRVLPKGLIICKPDSTGKVPMSTKDEQLVLHQILPPMREMGHQDQREDGKRFRPSRDVVNAMAGFLRL